MPRIDWGFLKYKSKIFLLGPACAFVWHYDNRVYLYIFNRRLFMTRVSTL